MRQRAYVEILSTLEGVTKSRGSWVVGTKSRVVGAKSWVVGTRSWVVCAKSVVPLVP